MIIDHLHNARLYLACHPLFARAFSLLSEASFLSLPDGRHEMDGQSLIAMPQRYVTRPPSEGKWEAHRRYIDIQYIREGAELMGWSPLDRLKVTEPHDNERDVAFFAGDGSQVRVEQGMFAVFFPEDAHMPCLAPASGAAEVRKIVLKVAVSA
jgi:YhcH/YjgK/YiaL family protein